MRKTIFTLVSALFFVSALTAQTTIIASGSSWKYLDNGSNQGTTWRTTGFNDASWASGNAQLGYGDGDEATVVSYGPNSNSKYTTTYFRKTVSVADASGFSGYTLRVKRDDGIVVYINGVEIYRSNMPAGTIAYNTWASANASDDGNTWFSTTLATGSLVTGNNVVAVEIHQNNKTSSDISFDLELTGVQSGGTTAVLTRGPYLQMGNQTAVTLRWRTDVATDSKIEVGTVYGTYTLSATNATSTTEHEVRITGLLADTKYYYRFGSSTQVLQNATDNYFLTVPAATTTRKVRIAAFGDCGQNSLNHQSGTLTAYRNYLTNNNLEAADAWLLLGDNAYNAGTETEYASNFFNPYGSSVLKNHKLYPVPGNHDYANNSSNQASHNVPYFSIFTLPANAECGGVASGNERYYSYDIGDVHFLALDSYGLENGGTTRLYDTSGAQVTWVKQDLAANTKKWIIAYWHHPPYTMGSHNSDSETELVNIRQNFIRILERLGVDVILCGHSHDYERSYLLNGYYGNESSFSAGTHTKSTSSAKYDGSANSCPYIPVGGANHGTVYVLSGSSGASGGTQSGYPHNAMPWSVNDGGMTYIEVQENRLDQKFIRIDGTVWDKFTIMKNVNKTTNLSIASGTPTTLTASWPGGTYSWSTGATTRSITVSPTANTTYTVTDGVNCVSDAFNVTLIDSGRLATTQSVGTTNPDAAELKWGIIPTMVQKGQSIRVNIGINTPVEILEVDINVRLIEKKKIAATGFVETNKLAAGTYFIKLNTQQKAAAQKFVVMD